MIADGPASSAAIVDGTMIDAAGANAVLDTTFLTTMPATTGAFIVLIAATLVLHMVFMQYSLAGSLWVAWASLRGRATGVQPDRVVLVVREWLPFAVSGAITAGIAPLLFVQVVYQGSFYTANLLLFNGWMAIRPALIVAMWMLYLSKAHGVVRARAAKATAALLAAGLIAFVGRAFVENHLLSMQPSEWVALYERGTGGPSGASVWSRLIAWTAMSFTTLAGLIAWQLRAGACGMGAADAARASRRLAIMAIVGVVLGAGTAWWHARGDEATARAWGSLAARPYAIAAMCGGALTVAAWGVIGARNAIGAWPVAAAITGSLLTLGGTAMVREVHRCAALAGTPAHARMVELGGGALVFAFAAIAGVAVIAWIMVQVRRGVGVAARGASAPKEQLHRSL